MDALGTKFHFHDGNMTVQRTQDCTPILDLCKEQQATGNVGSSEMKLAARIPNVVIENYCNVNGVSFQEVMAPKSPHIKRMLNDPDLAGFRVWRGRV
jgi:hypothetical protein